MKDIIEMNKNLRKRNTDTFIIICSYNYGEKYHKKMDKKIREKKTPRKKHKKMKAIKFPVRQKEKKINFKIRIRKIFPK